MKLFKIFYTIKKMPKYLTEAQACDWTSRNERMVVVNARTLKTAIRRVERKYPCQTIYGCLIPGSERAALYYRAQL